MENINGKDITVNSRGQDLGLLLKEQDRVREYANYIVMDGMSKAMAFATTFELEHPLSKTNQQRLYRWSKTDAVNSWLEKTNKSLEIDWLDKRVGALNKLYEIGEIGEKDQDRVAALDKFLSHLSKEENKLGLQLGGGNTVNIIQVVQQKLSGITNGAVIGQDGDIIDGEIE